MAGCMMWLEKQESERLRYHLNISRLAALNFPYGRSAQAKAQLKAQAKGRHGREYFECNGR
jgi:hypothetical protein